MSDERRSTQPLETFVVTVAGRMLDESEAEELAAIIRQMCDEGYELGRNSAIRLMTAGRQ